MNRWQKAYDKFIKSRSWESIVNHAKSLDIDTLDDDNTKTEAKRFVDTVSYINDLLEAVDPDLVALEAWDNISENAEKCFSGINTVPLVGTMTHRGANESLDSILRVLTPFVTNSKQAAIKASKSIRKYSELAESALEKLEELETCQKKRYDELNGRIESLLPGATSVGLARAFQSAKDERRREVRKFGTYFIITVLSLILVGAGLLFFEIYIKGLDSIFSRETTTFHWQNWANRFLTLLPIAPPIVWLAIVASKRRSESNRLREEYAHKEALAKSFENYKQQIEQLGEDNTEIKELFLRISVEELANNPSKTLDKPHGDKLPIEEIIKALLERINTDKLPKT